MTGARLEYIGRTLFPGENWRHPIAEVLAVHKTTVDRWMRDNRVRPGYEIALELLLERHQTAQNQRQEAANVG